MSWVHAYFRDYPIIVRGLSGEKGQNEFGLIFHTWVTKYIFYGRKPYSQHMNKNSVSRLLPCQWLRHPFWKHWFFAWNMICLTYKRSFLYVITFLCIIRLCLLGQGFLEVFEVFHNDVAPSLVCSTTVFFFVCFFKYILSSKSLERKSFSRAQIEDLEEQNLDLT